MTFKEPRRIGSSNLTIILAALLAIGLACGRNPEDPGSLTGLINVYSVLSPEDELHWVIVERAVAIDEPNSPETAAISDAAVRISTGGKTVALIPATAVPEIKAWPGTYLADSGMLPVLSGKNYQLTVETTSGDRIEGETTIPTPFRILEPPDSLRTAPVNRLEVSWTPSEGAFRYLVYAYENLPGGVIEEEEGPSIDFSTVDTTVSLPFLFNRPGEYVVEVWAVDENLYDYYRSRANRPEVEIINHLSGGIGVFGSRVVRRRLLTVDDL